MLRMKERRVWLLGDPDTLLQVARRPSGSTAQLALACTPTQLRMPGRKETSAMLAGGRDLLAEQLRGSLALGVSSSETISVLATAGPGSCSSPGESLLEPCLGGERSSQPLLPG